MPRGTQFLRIAKFDFREIYVISVSIEVLKSSWSRLIVLNGKITKIKNEIADAAVTALERDRSMSHGRDVRLQGFQGFYRAAWNADAV